MELIKNLNCAGGGKTTALASKFIQKIKSGEKIESIWCITFTNNAVNEIIEKIIKIAKKEKLKYVLENILNLNIYTIDSFFKKLYSYYDISINNKKMATVYEMEEIFEMALINLSLKYKLENENLNIFKNMYKMNRSLFIMSDMFFYFNTIDNNELELLFSKATSLNSININIKEYLNTKNEIDERKVKIKDRESFIKFNSLNSQNNILNSINAMTKNIENYFNIFVDLVNAEKEKRKIYDYEDINLELFLKIKENIQSLEFFVHYNIGHLFIDEFQDTSFLQHKIIEEIFNILNYGETKLSKNPSGFLIGDIKQSIYGWRGADSSLFQSLIDEETEINNLTYRCSQNIIDFVNTKFEKKWNIFQKHTSFLGYLENSKVNILNYNSLDYDKNYIDSREDSLHKNILNLVKYYNENKNETTCILVRTNDLLNQIKILLNKENIQISNQGYFFSLEESKILLNLLLIMLIENPEYSLNYCSKYFDINLLLKLKNKFKKLNVNEIIDLLVLKLNLKSLIPYEILSQFLNLIKEKNLELENKGKMVEFLVNVKNDKTILSNKNDSNIEIMTIHKSKGLEFDNVILIDEDFNESELKGVMRDKSGYVYYFPFNFNEKLNNETLSTHKKLLKEGINENFCLLYVALTRAKKNIEILKSNSKNVLTKFLDGELSNF